MDWQTVERDRHGVLALAVLLLLLLHRAIDWSPGRIRSLVRSFSSVSSLACHSGGNGLIESKLQITLAPQPRRAGRAKNDDSMVRLAICNHKPPSAGRGGIPGDQNDRERRGRCSMRSCWCDYLHPCHRHSRRANSSEERGKPVVVLLIFAVERTNYVDSVAAPWTHR